MESTIDITIGGKNKNVGERVCEIVILTRYTVEHNITKNIIKKVITELIKNLLTDFRFYFFVFYLLRGGVIIFWIFRVDIFHLRNILHNISFPDTISISRK